jgi:hypothetical protein
MARHHVRGVPLVTAPGVCSQYARLFVRIAHTFTFMPINVKREGNEPAESAAWGRKPASQVLYLVVDFLVLGSGAPGCPATRGCRPGRAGTRR